MTIERVWIEDGCILCGACADECPEVFLVTDSACLIRGGVREDGKDSENRDDRSPLRVELRTSLEEAVHAAVAGCPVEVIKCE